jgi:hypothetical protein
VVSTLVYMRSERLMLAFYVVDGCVSCMETSDEVRHGVAFSKSEEDELDVFGCDLAVVDYIRRIRLCLASSSLLICCI